MKYIELTQGKRAMVDDEDFEWLTVIGGWFVNSNGYVVTDKIIDGKRHIILMSRVIMNAPDNKDVDHRFGNKLDNRKSKLRLCTRKENSRNRRNVKGVYWLKERKKWLAQISCDRRTIFLGHFNTQQEAILIRNKAALKYFGEFARLNHV